MFREAAAVEPAMAGSSVAGTDQLDLEAAEQLIQLSGGDGADDDDGGSDSRSADSVKCRVKDREEAAAVESRRRSGSAGRLAGAAEKDGDGGEPSSKGAAESFTCSTGAGVEEKDKAVVVERRRRSAGRYPVGKDRYGGVVHGEARRRPKFRSLADIYKETETRRLALTGGGGQGHADRDPSEGERKKKRKRAAGEVIQSMQRPDAGEKLGKISAHGYVSKA